MRPLAFEIQLWMISRSSIGCTRSSVCTTSESRRRQRKTSAFVRFLLIRLSLGPHDPACVPRSGPAPRVDRWILLSLVISPLKGCLLKVREMLLAPSQLSSNPVLPAATFVVVLLEVSQVWRSIYAHLEASAHMEDAVHGEDVRQEGIAQPLTRRRAPDICTALLQRSRLLFPAHDDCELGVAQAMLRTIPGRLPPSCRHHRC